MPDLTNPKLIYLKGFLFLLCGCLSSAILIFDHPTLRTALLVTLAVWSFARFYYFAFYVIEHYIDPGYRFAGLWSFVRYCCGRGSQTDPKGEDGNRPATEALPQEPARWHSDDPHLP